MTTITPKSKSSFVGIFFFVIAFAMIVLTTAVTGELFFSRNCEPVHGPEGDWRGLNSVFYLIMYLPFSLVWCTIVAYLSMRFDVAGTIILMLIVMALYGAIYYSWLASTYCK